MPGLRVGLSVLALAAVLAAPGAQETEPECRSLSGEPLFTPQLSAEVRQEREQQLARALATLQETPDDIEAMIWAGRRTAYLGRYREAISIYDRAVEKHPGDARVYRHRGHRYITLREFGRAIEDLERAAALVEGQPDEIEPDGLPNARNLPRSTLQSNIWYHLGLAHYLRGEFEKALACYRKCLTFSDNPDMLCATSHWLYMTLRRVGLDEEAAAVLEPIEPSMEIIENHAYHELLLMYKGERSVDALLERASDEQDTLSLATLGYGIGNWFLYHGDRDRAEAIFRSIVDAGQWPAFGHIAAEADLQRLSPADPD